MEKTCRIGYVAIDTGIIYALLVSSPFRGYGDNQVVIGNLYPLLLFYLQAENFNRSEILSISSSTLQHGMLPRNANFTSLHYKAALKVNN